MNAKKNKDDKTKKKNKDDKKKNKNKNKDDKTKKKNKDDKTKKKNKDDKKKKKKNKDNKTKKKKKKSKDNKKKNKDNKKKNKAGSPTNLNARGLQRVLFWLASVDDLLLRTADPKAAFAAMNDRGVRSKLFYLEGILKLYRKRFEKIEPCFQRVKRLEDVLGIAEQKRTVAKKAASDNLEYEALTWLRADADQAAEIACEEIRAHWVAASDGRIPAIESIIATVLQLHWDDDAQDRAVIRKELVRRLEKGRAIEFDMDQLQGDVGLHELRRVLRWFPIYAVALDGLIQFRPDLHPVAAYASLVDDEIAQSPYAQLPPNPRETDPLYVSQSLFLANTQWIAELGALKDSGEDVESYQHAYMAALHLDAEAAEHKATVALGLAEDVTKQVAARANDILNEIEDNDVLGHFASAL